MCAKPIAAAHIEQGSSVTYRSQPARRFAPSRAAASRSTNISACAVGSRSRSTQLPEAATTAPAGSSSTAPTGTSPCAAAAFASARASAIAPRAARPICSLRMTQVRPISQTMPNTQEKSSASAANGQPERIAKVIARAGLCSRRDAERWIAEGRVSVNGEILTSPAVTVTADSDIRVDGKKLPEPERPRLWRYHKPVGLVTTHRDEKGRPTVFGALPASLPRLISVGRLDLNSEGLLLLTNDGALARRLELPATGWIRRYRVRVQGAVDAARLASLASGSTIDGVVYGPIRAGLERQQGSNAWLTLSLQEGKNREVRRVLEHLGLPVTRLIRVAYGPFQLGNLERGAIEEVPAKVLREQLGGGFAVSGARSAGRQRTIVD